MKKILFLVKVNERQEILRRDIGYLQRILMDNGSEVDVYDFKQKVLISKKDITNYNYFPPWLFFGKNYLALNFIVFYRFLNRNKNKYDIVHIHSVREEYLLLARRVKKLGQKLFITFFGSDINNRNFIKNNFKKLYDLADLGIVTNINFKEKVLKTIGKNSFKEKMKVLLLAQDQLEDYKGFSFHDKAAFKEKLGIALDKVVIVVGSGILKNEQHEEIILQLKELKNPANYVLVFPFSSRIQGKTALRIKQLRALIEEKLKGFNVTISQDFLPYNEMMNLRFASDILINLRREDQLNASMLESNLSYTAIITGSWLPYNDYISEIEVKMIDRVEQLNDAIERIIIDQNSSYQKLLKNRAKAIEKYCDHILNEWIHIYR